MKILITGTDHGLGRALTEEFLKRGNTVYAGDFDPATSRLNEIGEQYKDTLVRFPMDVRSDESVKAALDIVKEHKSMFLITAAGYLIALICSMTLTYEKKYPHKWIADEKPVMPKFSELFEKTALIPAICILLHGVAHISIMSFIAPYGVTLGINNVGLFFTINSVLSIVVSAVLAKLSGPKYRNKIFLVGILTFIGTMLCFFLAKNVLWFYGAAVFFSVAYAATQPILQSIAMAAAPENRKGAASATFQMFWDIGFGAGSVVLGAVASKSGYPSMYAISTVLIVIIGVVFFAKLRNIRDDAEEKTPEADKAGAEAWPTDSGRETMPDRELI